MAKSDYGEDSETAGWTMNASIHVYTFREGLLSKLGHDLRISVKGFHVTARGNEVVAVCDASTLTVDGAMKNGRLDVTELSDSDRQKIAETIRSEVLHSKEHPEIRFLARTDVDGPPFRIHGQLTICGTTRRLSLSLDDKAGRLVGSVELTPSEFGLKPYRALGGALKVQDRVMVTIEANADWLHAGAKPNPAIELVWKPGSRSSLRPV